MKKTAIILYGPPGSGKSTQANLLANELDLIHFNTGRYLEDFVHDPKNQKSQLVKKEKRLFDSGKLLTPSFVFRVVKKAVEKMAKAGWGIVFSGSPRTVYEAKRLMPVLDKLYGRKNVFVFIIDVSDDLGLKRNSSRLVCSVCKSPLLTAFYPSKKPKHCPVCAGPLYKRTLDSKKSLATRAEEYENRTKPIFELARKRGYRVHRLEGELPPFKVFKNILSSLG